MKSNYARQNALSFVVGLLFSLGLAISGMTQPQKVIGFLDPWAWDPSLLFVMAGAVGIHILTYRLIRRRSSPLLDANWHVPTRKEINSLLLVGSAIFGVGWGLGGYCPGPGVSSLPTGDLRALLFVGFMVLGMLVYRKVEPFFSSHSDQ